MYTQSSPCSPAIFAPLSLFFLPPQRCCPWLPARRGSHSNRPLLVDQWRGSLHSNRLSESQLEEEGEKKGKRKGEKGNPAPRDSCPGLGKSEIRHREVVSGVSRGHNDVGTSRTSLVLRKGGVTDTMRRGKVEVEQGQGASRDEFYFEIWGYKMRKPPNRSKFYVWCQKNDLSVFRL